MTVKEIQDTKRQLKSGKIDARDVPEEIALLPDIAKLERKLGLLEEDTRGFDVIRQTFFVNVLQHYKGYDGEDRTCCEELLFKDFPSFYDYLDGDIYDSACYQYLDFSSVDDFIRAKEIDANRILNRKALTEESVDDLRYEEEEEKESEKEINKRKKNIAEWESKFDSCSNADELDSLSLKYHRTKLKEKVDLSFYLYQYINKDRKDKKRFEVIMDFLSCMCSFPYFARGLCFVYDPKEVIDKYQYCQDSSQANYKEKRKLKEYVQRVEDGTITKGYRLYYDKNCLKYCIEVSGLSDYGWPGSLWCEYYDTFEEFAKRAGNNLSGADLSNVTGLIIDRSKYTVDKYTKLPRSSETGISVNISKKYWKGKFEVKKEWVNDLGGVVHSETFTTPYFFDFVAFLKGNLSDADLRFCDGLINVPSLDGIDVTNAKLTSEQCIKFGIPYERISTDNSALKTFALIEANEEKSYELIKTAGQLAEVEEEPYEKTKTRIGYVTDIHLPHRIRNCRTDNDIHRVVVKIAETIAESTADVILIGGDVSSSFWLFKRFVDALGKEMGSGCHKVFFVLGNHELWEFPGKPVDEIAEEYRVLLNEYGMNLCHNDLFYKVHRKMERIPYEELQSGDLGSVRKKVLNSELVIFGGTAFAGYNKKFNADNGVYGITLDREGEIAETKKFEDLYKRIIPVIYDRNTVIFTHMPKRDWSGDPDLQKEFIYVSGHTHRNEFYDDGDYRVYADNQVGYHHDAVHLKTCLLDRSYDCFADLADGIHQITGQQYIDFYRGKNEGITYNRTGDIFLLKKAGYYCFLHRSAGGSLTMMNGGAIKCLGSQDLQYYYNHMEEVIARIRRPLDWYTEAQQRVSEAVKAIGGKGTIHGCIVDITFLDHVYINPFDLKVTGYRAIDIIAKEIYPDVPALLKTNCPQLYGAYKKLLEGKSENPLVRTSAKPETGIEPQPYYDTDIYKASRQIKKMQKLYSNILSVWIEPSEKEAGLFLPGDR